MRHRFIWVGTFFTKYILLDFFEQSFLLLYGSQQENSLRWYNSRSRYENIFNTPFQTITSAFVVIIRLPWYRNMTVKTRIAKTLSFDDASPCISFRPGSPPCISWIEFLEKISSVARRIRTKHRSGGERMLCSSGKRDKSDFTSRFRQRTGKVLWAQLLGYFL